MHILISNRYLIFILALAFFNFSFMGCFTSREVIVDEEPDVKIERVLLTDSTEVDFTKRQPGYAVVAGDSILFIQQDKIVESYHVSQIEKIYSSQFNIGKTILGTIGIGLAVFAGFVAIIIISMGGKGLGG